MTNQPCAVKVTTPLLSQGSGANWSYTAEYTDTGVLTVNVPNLALTIEVVLVGDHLDAFLKEPTRVQRAARRKALRVVNA